MKSTPSQTSDPAPHLPVRDEVIDAARMGKDAECPDAAPIAEPAAANHSDDAQPTSPPTPLTPPTAVASATQSTEDLYDMRHCTITLVLQFLPEDGSPQGRQVLIGVSNPTDPPIIEALRQNELGPLPPALDKLLEQLAARLPELKQAAEQRQRDAAVVSSARTTVTPTRTSLSRPAQRTANTQSGATTSSPPPAVPRAQPVIPPTPGPPPPNPQDAPTQLSLFG